MSTPLSCIAPSSETTATAVISTRLPHRVAHVACVEAAGTVVLVDVPIPIHLHVRLLCNLVLQQPRPELRARVGLDDVEVDVTGPDGVHRRLQPTTATTRHTRQRDRHVHQCTGTILHVTYTRATAPLRQRDGWV